MKKQILPALLVLTSLSAASSAMAQTTSRVTQETAANHADEATTADACNPGTLIKDLRAGTVIEIVNKFNVYDHEDNYLVFQSGSMWGSAFQNDVVMEHNVPACKVSTNPYTVTDNTGIHHLGFVVVDNTKLRVESSTLSGGVNLQGLSKDEKSEVVAFFSQIHCGKSGFDNMAGATVQDLMNAFTSNQGESNVIVHCR